MGALTLPHLALHICILHLTLSMDELSQLQIIKAC